VRRLRRLSTLENGNKLKGRLTLNEVRWAPAVRCLKKWIRDGVQKKGTGQPRSRQKIVIFSVFIFKILIQKKLFSKKIYLLKE
jgi:hypothetical protein